MTDQPVIVDRILAPFREFASTNAASGIALIVASAAALILANSGLAAEYEAFWSLPISVGVGDLAISDTLIHWPVKWRCNCYYSA